MELVFHGAAEEVGRSCIELLTKQNNRFLIDAGIKLSEHGTELPSPVKSPEKIKGVFISHAHLDHTGFLPTLNSRGMKCPIYATAPTKATTRLLLEDAFKIGHLKHEHLGYKKKNISRAVSMMKKVEQGQKRNAEDLMFEFMSAGHIPGSSSMIIEAKDEPKRIFYTGDIKTTDTLLLNRAEADYKDMGEIDCLITEATYGNREHPDREKQENDFINSIGSTIENGGSVIIPVFAEGRAQEIMLLLHSKMPNPQAPVYIDGMSVEATKIIQKFPSHVRSAKALNKAFRSIKRVKGRIHRNKIIKKQGIFVTTSGMLTGGPVMTYMSELCQDSRNSLLLTGYQAEHTNGRALMEEGFVFIDGVRTKVKSFVKKYDFSAHSGQSELRLMIKKLNPKRVIIQHGDKEACAELAEWAEAKGFRAVVPKMDERIKL